MAEGKHALYRFYNAGGVLLYVGITADPARRVTQHEKEKDWFDKVSGIKVEWHRSRLAVLEAEALAIEIERPLFNIRQRALPTNKSQAEEHATAYLNALRALYYVIREGEYDQALAWIDGMWHVEKQFADYPTDEESAKEHARSMIAGTCILPVQAT